jgi:LPXTG-motif cell wall-anchored protein
MKTNRSKPQTGRRLAVGLLALLAMLMIGTALAATPSTTAYQFSSHPMISGTVVTVNDHQMVVDTDQGERVLLEVDTRTSAPRDLAPGMFARTEFLALDNCRFYAQRIVPVRDAAYTNRSQAYANTRDSREAVALSVSNHEGYRRAMNASQASWGSSPQTVDPHSPGTVPSATPTTADNHFSTRPMLSGTVATVNDHRLVLETDQGQVVGLVMDSRTMVPREVAPGSVLRVNFTPMNDGRYYARQISLIGNAVPNREQAYRYTRDSDLLLAQNATDCGWASAPSTVTSVVEHPATTYVAQNVVETLPQTASSQPLILLLGLLALGTAGVVTAVRRFWVV